MRLSSHTKLMLLYQLKYLLLLKYVSSWSVRIQAITQHQNAQFNSLGQKSEILSLYFCSELFLKGNQDSPLLGLVTHGNTTWTLLAHVKQNIMCHCFETFLVTILSHCLSHFPPPVTSNFLLDQLQRMGLLTTTHNWYSVAWLRTVRQHSRPSSIYYTPKN